jgi:hypothetical protein
MSFHPKLPSPASFPSYQLPLHARTLTSAEIHAFKAAARTGLYGPVQLADAFEIPRALAFAWFRSAIRPKYTERPRREVRKASQ